MTMRRRQQPNAPTTWTIVEDFIRTRAARGCSLKYEQWLRYTLGFLVRAHPYLPTTPEPLEDLAASLRSRKLSAETRRDIWAAQRRLYNWAEQRHGTPNPMKQLAAPLRKVTTPRYLTREQLERVIAANDNHPRENALIHLLADTGARIGEIAGMTWDDVTVGDDGPTALLRPGKTDQRAVPLTQQTLAALRRGCPQHHLWHGKRGPLTTHGLRELFQTALAHANLKGNPHLMRHTFAVRYLTDRGGDLISLMRIGGWKNIESVQLYLGLDMRDVRRQHALHSPIAFIYARRVINAREATQ